MTISSSDISIVLSGGLGNTNPILSLGGNASIFPVSNNINNVFSDITPDQASNGYIDFRCVYVVNNNAVDSFYDVDVSLQGQLNVGSIMEIGVLARNDVQNITINGSPTGGYITIGYEGSFSPHINWDPSPAVFALNIQNGLNNTNGLSQVVCAQSSGSQFTITFAGNDGDRNQNLLTIGTNAFTPAVANPTFTKIISGGPRNDVASAISAPNVVPSGVVFVSNSITIGTIRPEESFPLWISRNTVFGAPALANDNITLVVSGTAFA